METYLGHELRIPIRLGKEIIAVLALVVAVVLLARAVGTVGAGERGDLITYWRCDRNDVRGKPLFQLPYVYKVVRMLPQILKYSAPTTSSSKGSQVVTRSDPRNAYASFALHDGPKVLWPVHNYETVGITD